MSVADIAVSSPWNSARHISQFENRRHQARRARCGFSATSSAAAVFVVGDWHLFIQYCDCKISVSGNSLDSQNASSSPDECLLDLDGQRLVSVGNGSSANSWKFQFDLGGILEVWPSATYEPSDDMWSLSAWNGDIAAMRSDGAAVFEKSTPSMSAGNS
jgi:hypothetical protein